MHAFERSAPFWFSAVALLIVVAGIGFLIRARGRAYRLLEVAMLLNVFLTEVFLFYDVQFVALYGLAFNLVGLLIVHGLIAQEQRRARQKSAGEQATPLPPAGAENVLPRHTAPVE
jgi:hypothetical protein